MALDDRELFARLIQCEAGGEGVEIKVHTKRRTLFPCN